MKTFSTATGYLSLQKVPLHNKCLMTADLFLLPCLSSEELAPNDLSYVGTPSLGIRDTEPFFVLNVHVSYSQNVSMPR
jgi:hypothetical protein